MSNTAKPIPAPTPEQKRRSQEMFERAKEVVTTGNYDYAIELLLICCKLDPANILFRQTLRRTQKAKYGNSMSAGKLAVLSTMTTRGKMKNSLRREEWLQAIEQGEEILSKNPWDLGVQMDMAQAADEAGMPDVGIFVLDQARQKYPNEPSLNRALARLFEKQGHFQHAINLWQLVKEHDPKDMEAGHRVKDLAASETIARGGYAGAPAPGTTLPTASSSTAQTKSFSTGGTSKEMPAMDRATREAAPILAKIEKSPTDPYLYQQVANIYKRSNRSDKAKDIIEKGLLATNQNYLLKMDWMELEMEPVLRKLQLAEDRIKEIESNPEADEADEDGPSLDDLRKIRSRLKKDLNNREIDLFRLKAERSPNDANPRLELSIRLYQANQLDEAITELQTVRKDSRLSWKATMYLGLCFLAKKNWRLASRNLEEALAALPPSDETSRKMILYHLAIGNAEAGDLNRAVELGHDLQNIDYVYRDISKLLEGWEARLQQV